MTNNDTVTDTPTAGPLKRKVATGREHLVKVKPYEVYNVFSVDDWDPEGKEKLPVSFSIKNPNKRAISGRVKYQVPGLRDAASGSREADPLSVHIQPLTSAQIVHGHHSLTPGQQWDGTITRGLKDRIGKKVTGDLSPIGVVVEIWNTADPRPGRPKFKGPGFGRTIRADVKGGEFLSRDGCLVNIDCFAKLEWDRDWVIPYGDPVPSERKYGYARMKIQTRNIADGTPVRLWVVRIDHPDKPELDEDYAGTGSDLDRSKPEFQPGLQKLVVKDDWVSRDIGDVKGVVYPWVRMNKYDLHWQFSGRNYYAFHVAIGKRGRFSKCSERNYRDKKKRKKCLNLRYTVFIHRSSPAGGKWSLPEYTTYGNRLNSLFKGSRAYRPYLMTGGARSREHWIARFRHRYIVIFLGHASCGCDAPDHPVYKREPPSRGFKKGDRMDLYHSGFIPDLNACPVHLIGSRTSKASIRADRKKDRTWFGGCGHRPWVSHSCSLERGYEISNDVSDDDTSRCDYLYIARERRGVWSDEGWLEMRGNTPRLCYWNGGCRSMITTNLGDYFVKNGTKYYTGWVYSPACDYARFCYRVFSRFLHGPKDKKTGEVIEDIESRFLPGYRREARRGTRPKYNPRIMDRSGVLNPDNGPEMDFPPLPKGWEKDKAPW